MDGILLINKPAGYTSHDIVGIVRKKLHTKKVGHCGTLDPDATGVLVVCVNKATKAIQFLMSDTKVYRATLSLGKSTDTYDASGKILEEKEVGQISKAQVIDVLNSFLGKSKQKPPIYSAIKVNGKKLYEYARNGEEVEIKERDIEIMMIELIDFSTSCFPEKLLIFNVDNNLSNSSLVTTSSLVVITSLFSPTLNSVFSSWLIVTEFVRFWSCSVENFSLELQPCNKSKAVIIIINFFIFLIRITLVLR